MKPSATSVSSPDSTASVLKPITEFNGMRSSCVMLKKKSRCIFVKRSISAISSARCTSRMRILPADNNRQYTAFVNTSQLKNHSCSALESIKPASLAMKTIGNDVQHTVLATAKMTNLVRSPFVKSLSRISEKSMIHLPMMYEKHPIDMASINPRPLPATS